MAAPGNVITLDERAVVAAASGRAIVGSFADDRVVNRGTILATSISRGHGAGGRPDRERRE